MQQPSVTRMVHYVSFGTPGGEYPMACRAAVVTQVQAQDKVCLTIFNPGGMFFANGCLYDGGSGSRPQSPGFHPVLCDGKVYDGGTWHWPERV